MDTPQSNILRGVPQGDTASSNIFITVLEILLLQIKHDKDQTFMKFNVPDHEDMDGDNLKIEPLQYKTDEVTSFQLLGVNIDKKLLKLDENLEETKSIYNRKLNYRISTINYGMSKETNDRNANIY